MVRDETDAIGRTASSVALLARRPLPALGHADAGWPRAFTRRTIEFAAAGIGVSLVRSATLRIPTLEESIRNDRYPTQELSALGPIHRLIAPPAVADSAAWLCSDRSQRSCSHALMVADRFRVSLGPGPTQLKRKWHSNGGLQETQTFVSEAGDSCTRESEASGVPRLLKKTIEPTTKVVNAPKTLLRCGFSHFARMPFSEGSQGLEASRKATG